MKKSIHFHLLSWFLIIIFFQSQAADAKEILVKNSNELRKALKNLEPGLTVLIAPGNYTGDISLRNVAGKDDNRITFKGLDPANPPVFTGGMVAFHFASCRYITLKHISVLGCKGNGINLDDGGDFRSPSQNVIIEDVYISKIGPRGNHDGIKLSGVKNFQISNSRIIGWGGSAIDMVGCHKGIIENCHFEGLAGYSQRNGVQAKGGSSNILIQTSLFKNAGTHSVVIGGHTGKAYFRPQGVNYEAKDITVAGNRIFKSSMPIAWGSALGGEVIYNTIVLPKTAVVRIYQGTEDPHFIPCQGGRFAHNLVVIGDQLIRMAKFEKGILPETFRFHNNAWYSSGGTIINNLPINEDSSIYQVDPKLRDNGNPQIRSTSRNSELFGIGADNYKVNRAK